MEGSRTREEQGGGGSRDDEGRARAVRGCKRRGGRYARGQRVGHRAYLRFLFSARVSLAPLLEDVVRTSLMTPKRQKPVLCLIKYGS